MRSLSVFLLILSLSASAIARAENDQPPKGPPPALIATATVVEEQVRASVDLAGTATPLRQSSVAAEVSGRVDVMAVREGDQVGKKDVLVRLRVLPLELELDEAQAALAEIETRLQKTGDDSRRAESLFAKGFISEEELQSRQTDLGSLQRQLEREQAQVRRLRDRLERTTVRAPFAGRVVAERTEIGQWVDAGDPVADLVDLSRVKIRVPVPEQWVAAIALGDAATVHFAALREESFTGEVTAIVPQADLAARTFPVEVTVANPEGRILAGMLGEVTFSIGEYRPALLVPKDAFVPQPDGGGYLVKVEEGTAVIVPVRILSAQGVRFAVESLGPPLTAGDAVVVRGNERLRPGQQVVPTAAEGAPAQ